MTSHIIITVHRGTQRNRRRAAPSTPVRAAGVAWVSEWDRKVLMLLRGPDGDHPGTWAFPAGSVEAGELSAAAAVRELYEEAGCWNAPQSKYVRPVWSAGGFELFLYKGSKFGPILNAESDDFMWASIDNPPSPLHPGVLQQLDAVRSALQR